MTTAEMESTAPKGERAPWFVIVLRVLAVVAALGALGVFCYCAFRLTLTPVDDNGQAGGNTDPGRSLRFYWGAPLKDALLQLGGNLALLAPLGVLLPVVAVRLRGPLRLVVVGALSSLAIELVQGLFVMGRAFDVDDLILNTAGVLLAYLLIGRRVSRMVRGS
ncbi:MULTISPECIES: VanZ family protein [Thermomonosporaceae]|uniref:VanZ family protein n=1 Tax=Thermomonosporaceae TaxID=2012 RepID=UPI00255AB318|nr:MULTISPECIES: VanZ family protein [Thermomonosporaceae]MDL4774694.1 VanZ family protein [Actinomadura xylanilytica]